MKKSWLGFWVGVCISTNVFAGTPFLITNRASDLDPNTPAQAAILDALNSSADDIQSAVNNGFLSDSSQVAFLEPMAKANASSGSSLIVDRGGNPTQWVFGVGAQGGVNGSTSFSTSTSTNTLPAVGAGGQASLLVGTSATRLGIQNIGPLDGKRLMLHMNGLYFSKQFSSVSFKVLNLGLNAQYKLVEPKGASTWFGWGGLNATTGLNFSTLWADYSATLSQTDTTSVGAQTATVNVNLNYTVGVKALNFMVPLELSTNVRFLYLFTLYAGASADFNFGSSHLYGTATGPITTSYSTTVPGISNLFSGTGAMNLEGGPSQSPAIIVGRGFAGLQLNFSVVKLFFEGTTLTNGTVSGAAGLKVVL